MGREAIVTCHWGQETAVCNVLLEGQELIVRGELRHRTSLAALTGVKVEGASLCFRVGQERVSLALGAELAARWARAIATPPPSLAAKLGISSTTRLRVFGTVESEELQAAVAATGAVGDEDPEMLIASVRKATDLNFLLDELASYKVKIPPLWIVYAKGTASKVGETVIRVALREAGFIDTKVASVSATLTALRFVRKS